MTAAMLSGLGKYHGKNKGHYLKITYEQIQQLVDKPLQCSKSNAQWVIPSTLMSRVHAEQEEHGEYWMLWGDLDIAPPPMDAVELAIQGFVQDYEIYSSKSATEKTPKCRILIPLAKPLSGRDWLICQNLLNKRLTEVGMTPDPSTERTGQPCFLPNQGKHYESRSRRDGRSLDVLQVWAEHLARERAIHTEVIAKDKADQEARAAARANRKVDPSLNLIDAFNATYDVRDILLEAGYDQRGDTFRHPASESGSFSASVKNDRVHTLSTSDPLYSGGKGAHDAFSAFQVLFAGGDQKKALMLAGKERVLIDGKPWNEVKRAEQVIQDFESLSYDGILKQIESATDNEELMIKIPVAITTCKSLNEVMRKALRKRLAKKADVTVGALEADARAFSKVQANKDTDHLPAAREVVTSYGADNLIWANQQLWIWGEAGIWRQLDEREVKQRIHTVAENRELTASVVNSILDLVKTEVSRPNHLFNTVDPESIAVVNGVLSLAESGWTMRAHRREDYRTTLIPVVYDPVASAPRFIQFLNEVFDGVADKEFRIKAIQQGLGYTLLASCHLEKFFMLIGSGANGKSVLLKVVEAIVGKNQVSAVQPSQFENRFQRAHLDGKLANIITEIAEGAQMADAQLKALVSGELTTAEIKFKSPFDFCPIATHWYGTNHMPSTRDFSDALFRRAMILEFPNKFSGDKQDVNLSKKLKAELPGILNFALDGLAELLKTGQFVTPQSSVHAAQEWRLQADQVAQFVGERTQKGIGAFWATDSLYSAYRDWAEESGIKHLVSKKMFSIRLTRLGYVSGRGSRGSRGFCDIERKTFDFSVQANPSGFETLVARDDAPDLPLCA